MRNIECEIRSFITKEQFGDLLVFFNKNAKKLGEDEQVTFYFSGDADLRIQQNNNCGAITAKRLDNYSKIWLKKGKIHDESREEIEIKCAQEDFENLAKLFLALGYEVEIKWFRTRHSFKWEDIDVCLDYTKGYGHIIELEKMCAENEKFAAGPLRQGEGEASENLLADGKKVSDYLKSKLNELGVALTPKEEFDKKYEHYKNNWQTLIQDNG